MFFACEREHAVVLLLMIYDGIHIETCLRELSGYIRGFAVHLVVRILIVPFCDAARQLRDVSACGYWHGC